LGRGRYRSDFFKALAHLTDDSFITLVESAIKPVWGELRSLTKLREAGRKEVTPLDQLLAELKDSENHNERRLQYLLWHRRYLLNPHQIVTARDVPCCFGPVSRPTVSDFLVIDDQRKVPILLEVKGGEARDSLTGVLLELLVQWCFHKSATEAFRSQLENDGIEIDSNIAQPEALIAAPAAYYREAVRRSHSKKRQNEAFHALRLVRSLERKFELSVGFIVISDLWHFQGTGFRCHRWRPDASDCVPDVSGRTGI
jgi:hypothetical protein